MSGDSSNICDLSFAIQCTSIDAKHKGGQAMKCPKCGSEDVKVFTISNTQYYRCNKCDYAWKTDL